MKDHNFFIDLSIYKNVIFMSPNNTYIEPNVQIGSGTIIEPNVMIKSGTIIGKNNKILAGAYISDSKIGNNCIIGNYSIIRNNSIIKDKVVIGPHSEISRSIFESNTGAYHKCIILDAHVKSGSMLGAGVVTANTKHDGNNQMIIINENAKIGVNVSLVAPLIIGENSWIGAGSTITKDVEKNTTVIARAEQQELKRNENGK